MYVESLQQKNFRNLRFDSIQFSKGVTLFVGDNGQGKTNLLESLYFLSRGNSFRAPSVSHLVNNENQTCFVKGKIASKMVKNDLSIQIVNGKKKISFNNKATSTTKLIENFPLVLFSPESLTSIKDGPAERRNLVDDLLVSHSKSNGTLIRDYQKCLRSRNRLFKDYKQEKISKQEAIDVLGSLDVSFLELGSCLTFSRVEALRAIKNDLSDATHYVLENKNVEISVDYLSSSESIINWEKDQILKAMGQRLVELKTAEMASGTSLVGPHKHDIQFVFDGEDARYYCSQGQQRALILAFKMAQIMYHQRIHQEYPLLLLDDVLSELDPKKRENLISFVNGLDSQIIITTTDIDFSNEFKKGQLEIYKVSKGELVKYGE